MENPVNKMVLGVGYCESDKSIVRDEWKKYDVDLRFVDSTEDAIEQMQREDYVCVTVCTNRLNGEQLV